VTPTVSLRAIAAARRGNLVLGWPAAGVDNPSASFCPVDAASSAAHPAPSLRAGLSAPLLIKRGYGGTPPMPPVRGLRPLYPRLRRETDAPFVILSEAKNLSAARRAPFAAHPAPSPRSGLCAPLLNKGLLEGTTPQTPRAEALRSFDGLRTGSLHSRAPAPQKPSEPIEGRAPVPRSCRNHPAGPVFPSASLPVCPCPLSGGGSPESSRHFRVRRTAP